MVTPGLFIVLVALVALQRLAEVFVSRRHERRLLERGGKVHAERQMNWMRALHTGWLVAMPVEVLLFDREIIPPLALVALVVFVSGQLLRRAAMKALGPRWTVSVVTVPGERVVTKGIFSKLRHPNYFGVVLEIAALPLVHTAWVTALVFTLLNAALLRWRITAEERALTEDADYHDAFEDRRTSRSRSGALSREGVEP